MSKLKNQNNNETTDFANRKIRYEVDSDYTEDNPYEQYREDITEEAYGNYTPEEVYRSAEPYERHPEDYLAQEAYEIDQEEYLTEDEYQAYEQSYHHEDVTDLLKEYELEIDYEDEDPLELIYEERKKIRKKKKAVKKQFLIARATAILLIGVAVLIIGFMVLHKTPLEKGIQLLEKNKHLEAVETIQLAIEEGEELGSAYHALGLAYWKLENYEKSYQAFTNSLKEGGGKTVLASHMLGAMEIMNKNYEAALQYILNALQMDVENEVVKQELLFNEIICYEHTGQWELAKSKMQVYRELYPEDEEAKREAEFLESR